MIGTEDPTAPEAGSVNVIDVDATPLYLATLYTTSDDTSAQAGATGQWFLRIFDVSN